MKPDLLPATGFLTAMLLSVIAGSLPAFAIAWASSGLAYGWIVSERFCDCKRDLVDMCFMTTDGMLGIFIGIAAMVLFFTLCGPLTWIGDPRPWAMEIE